MSTKETLISVGLLAAGGAAIATASGAYSKGSRALGSEDLRLESEAGLDKGSRSGINVNDMEDEGRRTYSAGDAHVHVWLDLGVARDDYGRRVMKSGEWLVVCSRSPDPLNLSPRGTELERQTFRFADPKQRELVAMSANDYIRGLLFRHRGKGSAYEPLSWSISREGKGSAARAALTLDQVRAGDRVTIRDRFGHEHTGRAVMRSSHGGWVLNMGGKHGTPGLVDEGNFVRATRPTEKRDASSGRADWLAGEGSAARWPRLYVSGSEREGVDYWQLIYKGGSGGPQTKSREAAEQAYYRHPSLSEAMRAEPVPVLLDDGTWTEWDRGGSRAVRGKAASSSASRITPEALLRQLKAIPGVSSAHVSDTWPEDGFVQISVVLKTHGKISVATEARGRYQDLYQIPDYAKVSAAVRAAVNASGMPVDGVEGLKKVYAYLDPRYSHHGEKREGGFPDNTMVVAVYGEPKGSRATKERSGVKLRCYGGRTGIQSLDSKCGWSGDSGEAAIAPSGEERCPKCGGSTIPPLRFGKGSMIRDGSYEATLMFDADEDDPEVRAQRQLQANPYVPQARPLTAEPPRITSAQGSTARDGGAGSAARGVTDGYVEDYLNGENIAISTFLSRNLRGKAKSYSGQYARRLTAALEALVASGEVYRDTTPKGAPSYRRASTAGSAARGPGPDIWWLVADESRLLGGPFNSPIDADAAMLKLAIPTRRNTEVVIHKMLPKTLRDAAAARMAPVARGSSSVLRALTSKPKPPIPGPSLKMLDARLNLGGEEGKSLKHFMQTGQRQAALDYANELLNGDGVEYIASEQDTMRSRAGLEFVNMGDTYDTTLIYDFSTGRFYVGAWGDWVERYPKRFG